MWADFRTFIFRGNVIDLAVAVIIGASFTKIVTTLADGIISPFIGLATGGIDFKDKYYDLSGKIGPGATAEQIEAAVKAGAPLVRYGELINDIINFLIVALVVFLIVRWAGRYLKFMEATAPPTTSEVLLAEIRDELKSRPRV